MRLQVRALGDLVGGDRLSVGEGEHVGDGSEPFDQQTIRSLPAVRVGVHDVGLAERVDEQAVNQHDGARLTGRDLPAPPQPVGRDLHELRFEGWGGAEQDTQDGHSRVHNNLRRSAAGRHAQAL